MTEKENRNYDLEVIAGHCSFNPDCSAELYEMSEIQVSDGRGGMQRALSAERIVGLKSRTEYNPSGDGMGVDFSVIDRAIMYGSTEEIPPSVLFAHQFVRDTKMGIAAEIMRPAIQLPFYEGRIPKGQFLPWNPSIDQLGWSIREMVGIASRNNWTVGLKNGKWLGEPYQKVAQLNNETITSMEKTWLGLASFATAAKCNIAFIHRGVDIPEKGECRNAPVHEVVKRLAKKVPNAGRYFDPSHILGPNLRDRIVETTIEAMRMTVDNDFLYTGILLEAGTSKTDTNQHISISELRFLLAEIAKFRRLRGPFLPTD